MSRWEGINFIAMTNYRNYEFAYLEISSLYVRVNHAEAGLQQGTRAPAPHTAHSASSGDANPKFSPIVF